jgi:hypothetical protein
MRSLLKKKAVAIALTGAVVVGASIAAYAYWTAGGSGTGTAATGTFTALTAVQTSTITDLHPGDSAQTLSGTFTNPNDGPVYVTSITASIASVTKAGGAPAGTCDATDYTLANATMSIGAEVLADDSSTWSGATITFNNKVTNQDACKGATVNLAYTIV